MVSTSENGTRILKLCWNRLKLARVCKNKGDQLTMLLPKMMSRTLKRQSHLEIQKRRTTQWLRFLEWTGTLSKTTFSLTLLICVIMECHFRQPSVLFWSCQQWYWTRWDFLPRVLVKMKILFQELCFDKIDWVSNLPKHLLGTWNLLVNELKCLNNIKIPWLKKIIWLIGVLRRTVVSDWIFDNLCGSYLQSQMVLLVSWKFQNPGERFGWSVDRVAVGKCVMWLAVKTCAEIMQIDGW